MTSAVALTVLIFVSVECPVSNRYAPEIQRLYQQFRAQGVRFELIYPNRLDSAASIDAHVKAFGLPASARRDPDHAVVRSTGATITPEAAVLDGQNRLLYRGRIDDRFVALGRERPDATTHDLRDAIALALQGRPVAPDRTQAVGCYIADMK